METYVPKTLAIKIGSNTLTEARGRMREGVLAGLVSQIATLAKAGNRVLVVSSGAISCGLELIPMKHRPTETVDLQAASAVGQGRLFHRYFRLFAEQGVTAAQVLLTAYDIEGRSQYLNARSTLLKLLDWGIVPIINENDTISSDEIRYGDNDFLAAQAAMLVKADLLMLLTDTEGLYTSDPSVDAHARLVEEVTDLSLLAEIQAGGSGSTIGSGGMKSKIVAAEMATTANIAVVIANGSRPGVIVDIAAGEKVGTRFRPLESSMSSFKLWLKYGRPSSGAVVVDEGAATAIRKRGKSLLPAGIVRVEGHFAAGESVDVLFRKEGVGRLRVGKGVTNFSSDELRRIKGMQTRQVMKLLSHGAEEVIHRDYFVLAE